jgi:hypothetical protein
LSAEQPSPVVYPGQRRGGIHQQVAAAGEVQARYAERLIAELNVSAP